jgi:HSP20 family molecular chaperone IbpA
MEPIAVRRAKGVRKSAAPFPSDPDVESSRLIFSRPRYHCEEQSDTLTLVVRLPGADPAGVDLEVNAPDLTITATRGQSKQPSGVGEAVRDYQLRLRLGYSLVYKALQAELHGATLTVTIPKKTAESPG